MIVAAVGIGLLIDGVRPAPGRKPGLGLGPLVGLLLIGLQVSVQGTVLTGVAVWLFSRSRRMNRVRVRLETAEAEVVLAGKAIAIGLEAGMSPTAAIERAQRLLWSDLSVEMVGVLRHARLVGLGTALTQATGIGLRLYQVMGKAVQTGGPLADAVHAVTRDISNNQLAERLAAAKRLPVRLMIPLAFAILPGFVLMTLGPVVSQTLAQFDF